VDAEETAGAPEVEAWQEAGSWAAAAPEAAV